MFYYIVEVFSIVFLIYYYFTRTFNHWKDQHVKGPTPIPFFGNFIDVALRRKYMGQFYREVYNQYPNEKVVGIYRMTSPTLLIRDLDIVKQVLIKDFESCPDRGVYFSKEKLGDNLFHSDANTWKILRNYFTPLFTTNKCKSRFHLLVDRGDKFINYTESATAKDREQDMYRLLQKYTVATVMSFLFDYDVDSFDDNNKLFECLDKTLLKLSYGNEMDMLYSGILNKLNLSLFSKQAVQFSREVIQTYVNHKREIKSGKNSVMDVLMGLRQEGQIFNYKQANTVENTESMMITDDVLAGQVFIFYIAGYGNNTVLLTSTMYYLAKHPEVQEKLTTEIDNILEKYDGQLTFESINEMKYMSMVFDETLRMHPPANSLSRCAAQDLILDGINLTIKKGTTLIVSPTAIQRDEKYYPEPDKFCPERFENMKDEHPCAYLPFGVGPRSCLGSKFAKLQYGVCVAKLLSKFRVEPSQNTAQDFNNYNPYRLLWTPKQKIFLNLVPRS